MTQHKTAREDLLTEHGPDMVILEGPSGADYALLGGLRAGGQHSFAVYDLDPLTTLLMDALMLCIYGGAVPTIHLKELSIVVGSYIDRHKHLTGLNRPSIPGSVCWPICVALDRRKLPFHLLTLN